MAPGSAGILLRVLTPAGTGKAKGQRRAFPRWRTTFPVLHGFGVPDMGSDAGDISEEGMAFRSHVPYPTGAKIVVEMQLPARPIRVDAVIKHRHHGVVGVQFLNLSLTSRLVLSQFSCALPKEASEQAAID
ncbi:MAG: PilZ domain-containing protein [Terriglobales bacterium]